MHARSFSLLTATWVLAVLISGCGEQETRFPVAGKILIDGQPVTTGSIHFVPGDGRPFASKIGKDGSFRLAELSVSEKSKMPGVTAGKYKIGISSKRVVDDLEGEVIKHIPGKYADFRTSELEVDISGAKEDLLIELTWEGAEETEEATDTDSGEAEPAADTEAVEPTVTKAEEQE